MSPFRLPNTLPANIAPGEEKFSLKFVLFSVNYLISFRIRLPCRVRKPTEKLTYNRAKRHYEILFEKHSSSDLVLPLSDVDVISKYIYSEENDTQKGNILKSYCE